MAAHPTQHPHVVVHAPARWGYLPRPSGSGGGSRRVTANDENLGVASHLDDVVELLRLADLDRIEVEEDDIVEWQGGGPDVWPGLSEVDEP